MDIDIYISFAIRTFTFLKDPIDMEYFPKFNNFFILRVKLRGLIIEIELYR